LALSPNDALIWTSLGDQFQADRRFPEAIHAVQQAIQYTTDPIAKANEQVKLARLYLATHQPKTALQALDDAVRTAPPELSSATGGRSFSFNVAQGRAVMWAAIGDLKQATTFQEQAVQLDPAAADAWAHLAKLYERQGRTADQQRAEERGRAAAANPPKS
jgi:tetratricopeptide (TPR) repeat protein